GFVDAVVAATGRGAGEHLRELGLYVPVRALDHDEHHRDARRLRGEEAEPEPPEVHARPEREPDGDRRADAVERAEVDVGAVSRPRAAPEHAAAGGLRAVAELAEAEDRQHRCREREDVGVRREHARPRAAHGHGEREGGEALDGAQREPRPRRGARGGRPVRAELVADPRGHAEAERRREDVEQRRGLDEDPHGRHGGPGVGEEAAEQDHDLVPPPFEADAGAALGGQPDQPHPPVDVLEHLARQRESPGVAVHAGDVDEGEEEDDQVEVGPGGGERDALDAEAEDGDEEVVDGEVGGDGERGARRERQVDRLDAEVDPERVEEREEEEVGEAEENVALRGGGDGGVLAAQQEERLHPRPEEGDGHGHGEEEEHHPLHGGADEGEVPGAHGLAAHRLHAHGEAGQHGVPRDVGESDGERPAGERELAEPAEEQHRDHRPDVQYQPRHDHRQ
ncbi:Os10g0523201, partial [Oryza sativa Japonica Group]